MIVTTFKCIQENKLWSESERREDKIIVCVFVFWKKSEMGTSTNLGHTIGKISFRFLGGVENIFLLNYDYRLTLCRNWGLTNCGRGPVENPLIIDGTPSRNYVRVSIFL